MCIYLSICMKLPALFQLRRPCHKAAQAKASVSASVIFNLHPSCSPRDLNVVEKDQIHAASLNQKVSLLIERPNAVVSVYSPMSHKVIPIPDIASRSPSKRCDASPTIRAHTT